MKRWLGLLMLGWWLAGGAAGSQAARYQVIDLGTLEGSVWSSAKAINNGGQVLGGWGPTAGSNRLFLWDHGAIQDLGLGGYPDAINNLGQIVLRKYSPANGKDHAFLRENNGDLTDLGILEGLDSSDGAGLNDATQAVGWGYNASYPSSAYRGFLWQSGTMQALALLEGHSKSYALYINRAGQIVGTSSPASGNAKAILWQGGIPQDIGGLSGAVSSGARDINDHGQVLGWSWYSVSESRGFIKQGTNFTDLGWLPGTTYTTPTALNNRGQAVGYSSYAWLWENGALTNLNNLIPADSGWVLKAANDINDSGQIVGSGTYLGQSQRAFLLTPIPVGKPAVPAVDSLLLGN